MTVIRRHIVAGADQIEAVRKLAKFQRQAPAIRSTSGHLGSAGEPTRFAEPFGSYLGVQGSPACESG